MLKYFGLAALSLMAGLVCIAIVVQIKGVVLFTAHPVFMVLGYGPAMGAAILTYFDSRVERITEADARNHSRQRHRWLNILAFVLIAIGTAAIGVSKYSRGKPLIPQTWHAWIGAASLLGVLVQTIIGLLKYNLFMRSGERRWRWHGTLGRYTALLGFAAVITG